MDPVLVRQPAVDPKTGVVTAEWAFWLQALVAEVNALRARVAALEPAP